MYRCSALKALVFQFVGATGVFGWFIRLKGGGPYTHVDFVCPAADGTTGPDSPLLGARFTSIGGQAAGVRIRPPDYDKWFIVTRISIAVTDDQYDAALAFLYAQIGKPYDMTAVFGFMLNRDWREDDSWFCSELIVRVPDLIKRFEFPLAMRENRIDPCTAFAILSTYGSITGIKTP